MNQIDSTTKARDALRQALADRDRARAAADEAKSALARADGVVAQSTKEVARAKAKRDAAESEHAGEIAGAIRRGASPNATLPPSVVEAQRTLAEAESRHRAASAARATLAAELMGAEQAAKQTETAARTAAYGVIIAEARPLAARIIAASAELLSTFDTLMGFDGLGRHVVAGSLPPPPPELCNAIVEAKQLEGPIGLMRPSLPLNAHSAEAVAAKRWRDYLSALIDNPDIRLTDIPADTGPRPPAIQFDALHASRVSAASRVGNG